jgi:hypothetical protein
MEEAFDIESFNRRPHSGGLSSLHSLLGANNGTDAMVGGWGLKRVGRMQVVMEGRVYRAITTTDSHTPYGTDGLAAQVPCHVNLYVGVLCALAPVSTTGTPKYLKVPTPP